MDYMPNTMVMVRKDLSAISKMARDMASLLIGIKMVRKIMREFTKMKK